MLELIVIACLVKDPESCREHNLTLATPGMAASQCLYGSIPLVSRWQQMNREWKLKSWSCAAISDEEAA